MTTKFELIIIFMCQEILYFSLFSPNLLKVEKPFFAGCTKIGGWLDGSTSCSLSTLVLVVLFSGARIRQLFEESLRRV